MIVDVADPYDAAQWAASVAFVSGLVFTVSHASAFAFYGGQWSFILVAAPYARSYDHLRLLVPLLIACAGANGRLGNAIVPLAAFGVIALRLRRSAA